METQNEQELQFHNLNAFQLISLLNLDKSSLVSIYTQVGEYLASNNYKNFLNDFNFKYTTEDEPDEYNNRIRFLHNRLELSLLHRNIRSLNCNYSALCHFLQLLELHFDIKILSEI